MDTFVRRQASTHSVTFANTGVPRSPATWPPDDEEEFIVPALTPSGVAPPPGDEDLDPFSLDDEDNPILPPGSYQMSPETGTPDNPGCGREETPPPSLLDQFLFGLASSEDDPTPPS